MHKPDFNAHAARALETTRRIIEKFGPRLAGSQACLDSAVALQEEMMGPCGKAGLEFFSAHPGAFMGFYPINVGVYIIGVIFLHLRIPLAAAGCFTFILLGGFLEFGYYREFYDPVFPRRNCANVIASLEQKRKPTRQLIIGGHHDSAYELTWMRRWQKLYGLRVITPDIMYTIALLSSLLLLISPLVTGNTPLYTPALTWFMTLGILIVLPKFFIISRHGSPGAGDNLVASAMLVELARIFGLSKEPGMSGLEHTRLIFVSFDAEEAGLRGSRAFSASHAKGLLKLPTYMLNMDSIYNTSDIQFLLSDLNDTVPLSKELAERCARIAQKAGNPRRFMRMVFGGGGTDAAELAKAGIQATTLLAMPTGLVRDGLVYHTLNDNVDALEPAAVEACLRIAHGLALELDTGDAVALTATK